MSVLFPNKQATLSLFAKAHNQSHIFSKQSVILKTFIDASAMFQTIVKWVQYRVFWGDMYYVEVIEGTISITTT